MVFSCQVTYYAFSHLFSFLAILFSCLLCSIFALSFRILLKVKLAKKLLNIKVRSDIIHICISTAYTHHGQL